MTIQSVGSAEAGTTNSIAVQAKVVRLDAEGVGLEFVFPKKQDSRRKMSTTTSTANEKTLNGLLQQSSHGRCQPNTVESGLQEQ